MSDEIELHFKRFSAEKQEQIRQLVAYTTLMGLSGKDLVSIGGKLDRIKQAQDRSHNKQVVASYKMLPIGKDTKHDKREMVYALDTRFKMKINGVIYHFQNSYGSYTITNIATNKKNSHRITSARDFGTTMAWRTRERYSLIMDYHEGLVTLP